MKHDPEILIRPLETDGDFRLFEDLQKETWGPDIHEAITAPLAKIIQKICGIAAGAFDPRGEMLGFIFGFTGLDQGKPVHWSHMLAVKGGARDAGIGRSLKMYQRDVLLKMGVDKVLWTYDPLVAKNAHLNLNSLGAEVLEYVEDMYGSGEDSDFFRGIGTDRFVMIWHLAAEKVRLTVEKKRSFDPTPYLHSPLAVFRGREDETSGDLVHDLNIREQFVRVEIPSDVHQLMAASLGIAAEWRAKTREAFRSYMLRSYRVGGFYRDPTSGRCFYCLHRS